MIVVSNIEYKAFLKGFDVVVCESTEKTIQDVYDTEIDITLVFDKNDYYRQEEFARRVGRYRCRRIDLQDCETVTEYVEKHGTDGFITLVEQAVEYPIEGLFRAEEFYNELDYYKKHGYPDTIETDMYHFDNHIKFYPGKITTVTGVPSHGKSNFIECILILLARHGGKYAIFSPEHGVTEQLERLMSIYTGINFDYIAGDVYQEAKQFINEHFFFIQSKDNDFTINEIIAASMDCVGLYGINGVLIDPWNMIEHQSKQGETQHEYTGRTLTYIKNKIKQLGIFLIIIAHPRKMPKNSDGFYLVPTAYDISDSAHWYNKSDNILSVYREKQVVEGVVVDKQTNVYIQKIKISRHGKQGVCRFNFDKDSKRFYEIK